MPILRLLLSLSLASEPGLHQAAKRLYQQAGAAFAAGRYADAAAEFQAAYKLEPNPGLLFDVGQCDRKLGRWAEALGFFRRYLEVKPEAANRTLAEMRIAEAEGHVRERAPPAPASPAPARQGSSQENEGPTAKAARGSPHPSELREPGREATVSSPTS
ncbi:MAG: tetratricopeptide repeat protein, partial [Deltaproteobacteria bacterium]